MNRLNIEYYPKSAVPASRVDLQVMKSLRIAFRAALTCMVAMMKSPAYGPFLDTLMGKAYRFVTPQCSSVSLPCSGYLSMKAICLYESEFEY